MSLSPPGRPAKDPLPSHDGAGPQNTNLGSGHQTNNTISGGTGNQQFIGQEISHSTFYNQNSHVVNQAKELNISEQHFHQHNYPADPDRIDAVQRAALSAPQADRQVSVPFATVSTYTNRRTSKDLEEKLRKPYPGKALAHGLAVTGLGGTGKTQLVLHYIKEHEQEYNTILWIDARTEETTRASLTRCCRVLGLLIEDSQDDARLRNVPTVQALHQWLRGRDLPWLVIVDNADDLSWNVGDIIPQGRAGSVVVTSQDSHASRLIHGKCDSVHVDVMEADEAFMLLESAIDQKSTPDNADLRLLTERITKSLDCLPLAIDLAAARIKVDLDGGLDAAAALQQYLVEFQQHRGELLRNTDFAQSSQYEKTVWTVWETSLSSLRALERIQPEISPVHFLAFLTLFDITNIHDELFRLASLKIGETSRQLDVHLPAWLQKVLAIGVDGKWDPFYHRTTVAPLLRYGLVRPVQGAWKGLTMHELVRWRANHEGGQEHYSLYLTVVIAACQTHKQEEENVHFRQHLVVHLFTNEQISEKVVYDGRKEGGWMRTVVGWTWAEAGRWNEAEELQVKALEIWRTVLGPEHPDTLTSMGNLALTYSNQGRWKEAEELKVKALEMMRTVLGPEHPDTLISINNLASTYSNQGRWKEAEELEVKALKIWRIVLGLEHPDTLRSMNNLASTYRDQGRWKEAEELQVKVLETRRRILGPEHPDTLTSMNNLASTYRDQGRWKEAEELQVKALETRRRVLGPEHPDTLRSMNNLALTYRDQGRWKEAEELEIKALETGRTVLGPEHPNTLTSMNNLAITYYYQGRIQQAQTLMTECVEARTRVLGATHPDTEDSVSSLEAIRERIELDSCQGASAESKP